jgi:hypothetical protein
MKIFNYKIGDRVIDRRGNAGVILKKIEESYPGEGVAYKIKYANYKEYVWNKETEYAFYKEHNIRPSDDYVRVNGFKHKHQGTKLYEMWWKNTKPGGKFWDIKILKNHVEEQVPRNLRPQPQTRKIRL